MTKAQELLRMIEQSAMDSDAITKGAHDAVALMNKGLSMRQTSDATRSALVKYAQSIGVDVSQKVTAGNAEDVNDFQSMIMSGPEKNVEDLLSELQKIMADKEPTVGEPS